MAAQLFFVIGSQTYELVGSQPYEVWIFCCRCSWTPQVRLRLRRLHTRAGWLRHGMRGRSRQAGLVWIQISNAFL